MAGYSVRGRTVASAATAAHGVATLWNPHSTQRITVREVGYVAAAAPGAGAGVVLQRITARGTAGSTVTPGIAQDYDRAVAPVSGALLDLATYTVQPTAEGAGLMAWVLAAVAASGFIYVPQKPITVPPGAGLSLLNSAAIIVPAGDAWFSWDE